MREMIGTFRTRTHSAGRRLLGREKIKRTPLCSKPRFFEMTMIRGISLSRLSTPHSWCPSPHVGGGGKHFPPFPFPLRRQREKPVVGALMIPPPPLFFSFAAFAATRDRLTDLSLPLFPSLLPDNDNGSRGEGQIIPRRHDSRVFVYTRRASHCVRPPPCRSV